jgi:predicted deacetylase
MRLIFRYDDFSATHEKAFFAIDQAIFELFLSLGVPMVIGVTPNMAREADNPHNNVFYPIAEDTRRVHLLRHALDQGFQLALHGFAHQTSSMHEKSEFKHVPYQVQRTRIDQGMEMLSHVFTGTPVEVFIPPWNRFDDATVTAVAETGIPILCGGEGIQPSRQRGVLVIPACKISSFLDYIQYYSLTDLITAIGEASLVVTLHAYQFDATDERYVMPLTTLRDLLHDLYAQGIPMGTLSPSVSPHAFIPRHARLVWARLDLLSRHNSKPRRFALAASVMVGHLLGKSSARKSLDVAAQCLHTLKTQKRLFTPKRLDN